MPPPGGAARPVPITSFPGLELDPAISPAGNFVAFAWEGVGGDNFDIYVRSIDGKSLLRTHERCRGRPCTHVVARRSTHRVRPGPGTEEREIIVLPALGGPEQRLFEAGPECSGWIWGLGVWAFVDAGRQAPGLRRSERLRSARPPSICSR